MTASAPTNGAATRRLLVVDDDPDILSSLEFSLEGSYRVDIAGNGAVALEKIDRGARYDVILVDLMMPVMSGESLISELKARGVGTPVILLSAATDLAARARRLGAQGYMAKPFGIEALEDHIQEVIGRDAPPEAAAKDAPAAAAEEPPAPAPEWPADPFRLLADTTIDVAMAILDPGGRILAWNPGAERLCGWRSDEMVGRHFSLLYPGDQPGVDRPARALAEASATGRCEEDGFRLRQDGSRFRASVVTTALRDGEGRLLGFGHIARDFAQSRAAAEELRRSEEKFRLLVERVSDYAIFMLDPEGRVTTWNVGAERIKGYSTEEITGRHFSLFYTAEDLAAGKPARKLQIAEREGRVEDEGWRVRKDGTLFWANVVITALRDASGELRGFAKVTRDLTAWRKAEAQSRELVRAQAENAARSAYTSMMAHELRTPLTALKLFVEGIRRRARERVPELDPQLGRLRAQVDRLEALVNDLGDAARIESGREITLRLTPDDLGDVVRESVQSLRDSLAGSGQDLSHPLQLEVEAHGMPVRVDRRRVEQILANLFENAIKYSPAGGPIEVAVAPDGRGFRVDVQDHGIGVSADDLPRLAEPYFRAANVSAENFPGMGLGLAISAELARRHGGRLDFASELGKGTRARLWLPRDGG